MSDAQVEAIRKLIEVQSGNLLLGERRKVNVLHPPEVFDRDRFWKIMIGCLCSSMQRVNENSPLIRFEKLQPFPLSLEVCKFQTDLETYAHEQIHKAGIRFGPTIGKRVARNFEWLNTGGWNRVKDAFHRLAKLPRNAPAAESIAAERDAARLAMELQGIGPKQSRNLWMNVGVTRYGLPIDSRLAAWVNHSLAPLQINVAKLGNLKYYEAVESEVQKLCEAADVLPCEFDAAAFMSGI